MDSLSVSSTSFKNKGMIPSEYTCDGIDISPSLDIKGIPAGTKSLVLIVDDPDAPMGTWVHWVVWNIPSKERIEENTAPGIQGKNSAGRNSWHGPCPPSGTHRYFFKVYALDKILDLSTSSGKNEVEKAIDGHILAKGETMGLYSKKQLNRVG